MSEKHFHDDDDADVDEKIGALRSRALAKPDDKASISKLLKDIQLENPVAGSGKNTAVRKRMLGSLLPPPPPLRKPLSTSSSLKPGNNNLTVASIVQLAKLFHESRLENEILERLSDSLQMENEALQELCDYSGHLRNPGVTPNLTKIKNIRQGAHYLPRSLNKIHDMLSRERALLCSQISSAVSEVIGLYAQATIRPIKDEEFAHDSWQESEQGQAIYCFRTRKRLGLVNTVPCIIRVDCSQRRLLISSKEWLQDIRVPARNLASVSLSSMKTYEVVLVRQRGTIAEIDTLVFSNSFYSTLFIEKTKPLLSNNDSENAFQHSVWTPNILDTSGLELSPELHDLAYFVNEKMKSYWITSPEKEWLRKASDAILLDQDRLRYLTGGTSSSITMEISEAMIRVIVFLKFSIIPAEEARESVAKDQIDRLITELATNMHGHWCLVVNRLQELAAKGYTKEIIPERQPDFFREAPFNTLPTDEQQRHRDDAQRMLAFINEFEIIQPDVEESY